MSVKYKTNEWHEIVTANRTGVMQCLADIRNGLVDELTLDKLHNFCQQSLALMSSSGSAKWQSACKQAEIASYMHNK